MAEISGTHVLIYRLVKAIENYGNKALLPFASTLTAYLRGTDEVGDVAFYQKNPSLRGILPKANLFVVLKYAGELVDEGYLSKRSLGGKVCYSTTNKYFLEAEPTFIERLPNSKKLALLKLIKFVKSFCPSIIHKSERKFYAFALPKEIAASRYGDEWSWFWVSNSARDAGKLEFRIRRNPEAKTYELYYFDLSNVDEIIDVVINSIEKKQFEYGLNVNYEAKMSDTQKKVPLKNTEIGDDLVFNDFIDKNFEIYLNKETAAMDALLFLGECSPFAYTGSTKYEPIETALLTKGKRNFDYSMSKWKLVCWTVKPGTNNLIMDALLINKKTKSLWIVLSACGKKVKCVSKRGFCLRKNGKEYSSRQLIALVF